MIGQLPTPAAVTFVHVGTLPKRVLQSVTLAALLLAVLGILAVAELAVCIAGAATTVVVGLGVERVLFEFVPEVRQRRSARKTARASRQASEAAKAEAEAAMRQ